MLAPYQRRPYTPDTRSMAALIQQEGDDQARLALARGQIWANATRTLGDIGAGTLAELGRQKADAPKRELEQAELRERTQQLRDATQQRGLRQMAGAAGMTLEQEADLFAHEGFREQATTLRQQADTLRRARQQAAVATLSLMDGLSRSVAQAGYDPDAFTQAINGLVKIEALTPEQAQPYLAKVAEAQAADQSEPIPSAPVGQRALTRGQAAVKAITEEVNAQLAPFRPAKEPELVSVGARGLYDPKTGQIIGAPAPEPAKVLTPQQRFDAAVAAGDTAAQEAALRDIRRVTAAGREPKTAGGASEVSPAQRRVIAQNKQTLLARAEQEAKAALAPRSLADPQGPPVGFVEDKAQNAYVPTEDTKARVYQELDQKKQAIMASYHEQMGEVAPTWPTLAERKAAAGTPRAPAPAAPAMSDLAAPPPPAGRPLPINPPFGLDTAPPYASTSPLTDQAITKMYGDPLRPNPAAALVGRVVQLPDGRWIRVKAVNAEGQATDYDVLR